MSATVTPLKMTATGPAQMEPGDVLPSDCGGVPAGAILPFAMSAAPSGYLVCDGSAVSRTTYANLYSAIGTTYGTGDGSTTFNLPDYRGVFLRGWDNGRGLDSGRVFGTTQTDAMQGHRHRPLAYSGFTEYTGNLGPWSAPGGVGFNWGVTTGDPITDGTNGTPRTAAETRPVNKAVLICIKY